MSETNWPLLRISYWPSDDPAKQIGMDIKVSVPVLLEYEPEDSWGALGVEAAARANKQMQRSLSAEAWATELESLIPTMLRTLAEHFLALDARAKEEVR